MNTTTELPSLMVHRTRIHDLIEKGLCYPQILMLAGPGYGKTVSMSSYLSGFRGKAVLMRLSKLDNYASYFWNHFIRIMQKDYRVLSDSLDAFGFPENISSLDAFQSLLLKSDFNADEAVLVLDDFGEITDPQVKEFFWSLARIEPRNFRLVFISNVQSASELLAMTDNRQFLITTKDLRFAKDEIGELYQLHNITPSSDEIDSIERYTEGWPLALNLLVQSNITKPSYLLNEVEIRHLFDERFFASYSPSKQRLLICLSQLESFTMEFVSESLGGDALDICQHTFLIHEPSSQRYTFHHLYRIFLQKKEHLIDQDEVSDFWSKVARYEEQNGNFIEAIEGYKRCHDHIKMLSVITEATVSQYGIADKTMEYFLACLEILTPDEIDANPIASIIFAAIYTKMLELKKAEAILLGLQQKLKASADENAPALLGNLYIMLGIIGMMESREDFGNYFKLATNYPTDELNLYARKILSVNNHHNFSMHDNSPHAKERMEGAVHEAVPYIVRTMNNAMDGMQYIFSAESAYMSNELERAKQNAYHGIHVAERSGQHDLVCNGWVILARAAHLQGDFDEMTRHIDSCVNYSEKFSCAALTEIRDTALAWYYIKLRDEGRVPRSFVSTGISERPLLYYGRALIVFANFLIRTGEYARLIAMMKNIKGLYFSKTIWAEGICQKLMLAIGYYHLDDFDNAVEQFWYAYDMSHQNGLIAPFIEAEHYSALLADKAREQNKYQFRGEWLDEVAKLGNEFSKTSKLLIKNYRIRNPNKSQGSNPLSKREREVLKDLAKGFTREEIASRQYISVSTVKSAIKSIYNKLCATNRAEAVAIAFARGYIDGYV